ncbi:MAG: hypothetical protein A2V52_02170 [Actinobacteria bacterium RBG_19FT_COMBO_54_7]|nr:MAG: hypothetical protein A2V52_02170 [Actinobacteria bacterium RBG_19FT_COMBO_54_7]
MRLLSIQAADPAGKLRQKTLYDQQKPTFIPARILLHSLGGCGYNTFGAGRGKPARIHRRVPGLCIRKCKGTGTPEN